MSPEARERASTLAAVALLAVALLCFHGTAVSTSAARIALLRTVEPYAFAVHEQLIYNKAFLDTWVQTVHAGYDDAWTWSGHRAPTLWLVTFLYALEPSALWLSELMIGAIGLGVVPAALIGRQALGSPWGLALGGLLYLSSPAVMATALQDYQDLCFALPFLTFTLWSMRQRSLVWVPVGVAVGVLPREECVPLVVAAALVTWPRHSLGGARWKRWLAQVGLAVLLAGIYAAAMQLLAPITFQAGEAGARHDTPVVNAMKTVLAARGVDDLTGLAHLDFYGLLWAPLGGLALLSPLTALPAVGLVLMHLTVPLGHGVDRAWYGHAHHLAPALPFLLVAAIEGAARLLRFLAAPRLPGGRALPVGRAGPVVAGAAGVGLMLYSVWWVGVWGQGFGLVRSAWPQVPDWRHPVWELVEELPEDAVPIVSISHAIAVSDRPVSYTYEESLFDKARGAGLAAGTHLIFDGSLDEVRSWAMAMDGARVVGEHDGYLTVTWDDGARDRAGRARSDPWPRVPHWAPAGESTYRPPGVGPVGGAH